MTITEAIRQVMHKNGAPMTIVEAYQAIVRANLYEFRSDNPVHIVRTQIRRHCKGLDFPSASPIKLFQLVGQNSYAPLDLSLLQDNNCNDETLYNLNVNPVDPLVDNIMELQLLHERYILELKKRILIDLKRLSPSGFEAFAKRLLDVYGFHDMRVTQITGDGGVDGYGKLKVGLAHLNVAFQCKRWLKGNVQRPEVDRFRGAIQGDFEQGLFFTTASFSAGAIGASIKKGAVPIVLVDGDSIIDLMIEKERVY
jgi:restriction system protein